MIDRTEQEIMKNWNSKDNPVVSVCSTTYNHENYISEAIDSFLMQKTSFPFEIIIRDDCSTDKTATIIKTYVKKYPTIIKPIYETENQFSKGVRPMPEVFKKALGKYFALCEGDDYWTDPLKLQKQVDFLETNPGYGLVCTDMIRYNQKEGKYFESDILPLGSPSPLIDYATQNEGWIYEELIIWRNQIWTLTACFRKDLLLDIPDLDTSKYFTGDVLLFLHFSLQSKVKFFPEKTAVYRILEQSASHFKSQMKAIEFTYKVANLMLYYLDKNPVNTKLHQIVFYRNMLALFKFSRVTGNYEVFKSIQLHLPTRPSIKMMILQLLFTLCKWKPFFIIYSYFNKKQIELFS